MIIVSQDKKKIIDFNNMTEIFVSESDEDGNKYFVFYLPVGNLNGLDILGEYETEERAKEVIEEIVKQYEHEKECECDRSHLATLDNFTYRMPKE